MIFPLEQLVQFKDNIYEITSAASRRAFQLSMLKDPIIDENDGKVVSLAAKQVFTNQIQYSNLEFFIGITAYCIRYFSSGTCANIDDPINNTHQKYI